MKTKSKFTKEQQVIHDRFQGGDRIHVRIISGGFTSDQRDDYRWRNGELCRYRTFWNYIRVLFGREGMPEPMRDEFWDLNPNGSIVNTASLTFYTSGITITKKNAGDQVVVFDGTSHFVESIYYELGEGEEIVSTHSTIEEGGKQADKLNSQI